MMMMFMCSLVVVCSGTHNRANNNNNNNKIGFLVYKKTCVRSRQKKLKNGLLFLKLASLEKRLLSIKEKRIRIAQSKLLLTRKSLVKWPHTSRQASSISTPSYRDYIRWWRSRFMKTKETLCFLSWNETEAKIIIIRLSTAIKKKHFVLFSSCFKVSLFSSLLTGTKNNYHLFHYY